MDTLRRIIRNDQHISSEDYLDLFSTALAARDNKSLLAALLATLSAKPFNVRDAVHFVRFIEQHTPKRTLSVSDQVVNIVGTGGGIPSFNISTTATFVAAAAGAMVLKSGSYSYNSRCGSLDVLAQLGIDLNLDESSLERMLKTVNIGFVSPRMYPSLLRRMAISIMPLTLREIGGFINTVGPLICPFKVKGQICGVRSMDLVQPFAQALHALEIKNSISVWSEIGLDEFSAIGKSHLARVDDEISESIFDPTQLGIHHNDPSALRGGTPQENAELIKLILDNRGPEAARDTVVLNAAFVLLAAGQSTTHGEAIEQARMAISTGAARDLLRQVTTFTKDCAIGEIA